jgi:transglutaminase-like putative cysteine protease
VALARPALVLALALALPARAAPPAFGPAPAWTERPGFDERAGAPPEAAGGIHDLLLSEQMRLGPGDVLERHRRSVRRILSTTGVDEASELRVTVDPQHERLWLHEVTIHRGGRRIDALDRREVKVLQREEDLDRRLFDGRVTAVVFVHGLRAGDVLEYAWTIRGRNPVLGNRIATEIALGWGVPVARLSVRLVAPAGRAFRARVHGLDLAPAITRRRGVVEYRWERTRTPAELVEGDVPADEDEMPWLQLSEWSSWAEVARWAAKLYAVRPPNGALAREVRRWRRLPREAAAVEAIRFVQDDVRYLGIEVGPSAYRPHPPAEVLRRRLGDCKDKSLLLVTLLRALGIEAEPALVSTGSGEALDRRLPSPREFDHVIVRLRPADRWIWIDPTVSLQRGPLASRPAPPFRRALPVARTSEGLVSIGPPGPSRVDVATVLNVPGPGNRVSLLVKTAFRGDEATRMRQRLASTPMKELARGWLDFYSRFLPGARHEIEPRVLDDAETGALVVEERDEADALGRDARADFEASMIQEHLGAPRTMLRKRPLAVRHPVDVSETFLVTLPGRPTIRPDRSWASSSAARLTRDLVVKRNYIEVTLHYRSRADRVAPASVPAHTKALERMRDLTAFSVPLGYAPATAQRPGDPAAVAAAAFVGLAVVGGGVAAFVVLLVVILRRRASA